MHEVSVTLRLCALHSIQLPLLLIHLQSPAVPAALLLPRVLVVTLCTPPTRRWGLWTNPTPAQDHHVPNSPHFCSDVPPIFRYKNHDRPGRPDVKRDTCHEKKQGPVGRRSSNARQLGCVFHDMKPPKSILRKSSDMQKPIQRVKFTKAIARHTKIRDQNPSLGFFCPSEPHQRSPNAPIFEDRSQEETEWQEQGAREAAWKLAKNVLK